MYLTGKVLNALNDVESDPNNVEDLTVDVHKKKHISEFYEEVDSDEGSE